MVYILYGADAYSKTQELANIKYSLGDADMLSVNTCVLDSSHVSVNEILDTCRTAPFLNPVRLVIVDGFIGRFGSEVKKKQEKKNNALRQDTEAGNWKDLAECLIQLPPTTTLIFMEDMITLNNPVMKALSPLAKTKNFPSLRESDLIAWVKKEIGNAGIDITAGAIRLLINLVGSDLWALHNEIEKLISFCQGRSIRENDIKEVTSYSREISIFTVVDWIIEHKFTEAQILVKRMVKEGATSAYILTMIMRQLRLIIMSKYLEKGMSKEECMANLGLKSEFALNKTLKQAKDYSIEQLQFLYEKMLELDVDIKTGKFTDDIELDMMIFELCKEQVD